MRILAVDYGERRTGMAVSDELCIAAHGLDTIEADNESEIPGLVAHVAEELGANKIIVGLPLNMDGTESEKSIKIREFGAILAQETSLPIVFWDERLTTIQAKRVINEMGKKTAGKKHIIDRISATLILQDYLKTHI